MRSQAALQLPSTGSTPFKDIPALKSLKAQIVIDHRDNFRNDYFLLTRATVRLLLWNNNKGSKIIRRFLGECAQFKDVGGMKCLFAEAVWRSSVLSGRSKIFCVEYRKTLMAFRFLRTHSRLHPSDKVWVGDGSARLFPVPPANVQYACNNRNFANRIERGLCPLLSHQPKPQSHTKWNKRKWGMGGMSKTRNNVSEEIERTSLQIQDFTKKLLKRI